MRFFVYYSKSTVGCTFCCLKMRRCVRRAVDRGMPSDTSVVVRVGCIFCFFAAGVLVDFFLFRNERLEERKSVAKIKRAGGGGVCVNELEERREIEERERAV